MPRLKCKKCGILFGGDYCPDCESDEELYDIYRENWEEYVSDDEQQQSFSPKEDDRNRKGDEK